MFKIFMNIQKMQQDCIITKLRLIKILVLMFLRHINCKNKDGCENLTVCLLEP